MLKQRGFTLVELLVTVAVIAVIATLAVPTMRDVIERGRLRASSESIQNGLAQARAEAVRSNTQVEFVLSSTGWQIRRAADATVLQQASGKERSTGVKITSTPAGSDRITFNAFGLTPTVNPSDGSNRMTQLDVESTNPSGSSNYRPLRIQLLGGGMSRLCDPKAKSTEPKACL